MMIKKGLAVVVIVTTHAAERLNRADAPDVATHVVGTATIPVRILRNHQVAQVVAAHVPMVVKTHVKPVAEVVVTQVVWLGVRQVAKGAATAQPNALICTVIQLYDHG